MLRTSTILILAPLLSLVSAVVSPSEPGPGASYTAGQTCRTTWDGDAASPDEWKDMSIQLMTGDNIGMVHLTTVATGLDGTQDGVFQFTCPEVDPYSAIYFYQFTSPNAEEKTWATRFTILSPTGESVPPANARQPGAAGAAIPWGVGKLVNTALAVPPPAYLQGGTTPPVNTTSAAVTTRTTATASLPITSPSGMALSRTNTTTSGAPKTTGNTTAGTQTGAGSLGFALDKSVVMGVIAGAVLSVFAL